MTVIANAGLVLKDSQGNKGIVKSFTDKDIDKISNAITDVGQVVDPATHMPIEATTASVGVVQLATAQDITNGTAGKVVDAHELNNFAQTLPSVNGVTDVSSGDNSNQIVISKIGGNKTLTIDNVEHAATATKLQNARVLTIADGLGNSGVGDSFDGSKNVTISLPPYIATQLLKDRTKNDGNDYYDDSDITSLIYAGNGAGTIRDEIANGNFSRVHPGQTIIGRVTGTTYLVVGCNIYLHRGNPYITRTHIGLMPIQLIGNAGNLLWSGRTYAGSGVNNTTQGYAPWASDNNTEGKNQTSCYKDSYIANTVLPKVDNLWLKPDFENQGISILTFSSFEAASFDVNATCMSNPNWRGCAIAWGWTYNRRLVLPSEPEVYGNYHWAGSPYDSGSQHTQLPLYRHREIHKVYPGVTMWLKDSAHVSNVCTVYHAGLADCNAASYAFRVCPVFLIA